MTHHDASVLLVAIHKSGFTLTPKDRSVIYHIVQ